MRVRVLATLLASCEAAREAGETERIVKSDAEWREQLSPEEYAAYSLPTPAAGSQ